MRHDDLVDPLVAEEVCEQLAIINHGRIVAQGRWPR